MAETKKYFHNLDVAKNKIVDFILNPATTVQRTAIGATLGTSHQGYTIYDTDDDKQYFWDGAAWVTAGGGSVPTLQQVVNTGNGISNFGGIGYASMQFTNFTSGRTLYLNDNGFPTIRIVDNANASNYLQIDIDTLNIDGTSYNWSSIVNPPTSPLVALPFTTDHITANGNQYVIGDVVYYLGNVYRCIAGNDSILPTNTLYWTSLGTGYPLIQQPADWNSTSGNNQILNKPTIPAAQVNSDWNAVSGLAEILNKPTIPTVGTWGALNYPVWASGTPFVKMDAAGSFTLDTNTYLTDAPSDGATYGRKNGSWSAVTSSVGFEMNFLLMGA